MLRLTATVPSVPGRQPPAYLQLPNAASSVVYNGYVYEIGGFSNGWFINTVDYAPINSNGTLGSWTATTSLPAATEAASSVVDTTAMSRYK